MSISRKSRVIMIKLQEYMDQLIDGQPIEDTEALIALLEDAKIEIENLSWDLSIANGEL